MDIPTYTDRASGADESMEKKGKKQDEAVEILKEYPLVKFSDYPTLQNIDRSFQAEVFKMRFPLPALKLTFPSSLSLTRLRKSFLIFTHPISLMMPHALLNNVDLQPT
ncbi:uncharacterized protein EI90DRAFT_3114833 [Cantharellus anzutake]|uniref:uncharacterized protein n=1 Tax=Cantharellus anzutake TaxID=1750568 RepID=UPI0019071487|nr:uncharacterized protein EI90DRAFT_3114833 [Cantharellus anzutake]KAF8344113.1 hypothetical protein EI90DRAFT_3114833 [Cantharellus anzutake]